MPALRLSKKECSTLVSRMREATPTDGRSITAAECASLQDLLAHSLEALPETSSHLWAVGLHRAVGGLLAVLVDREATREHDPSEELLFLVCGVLTAQIEHFKVGDPCYNIGRACLGSLANLALDIGEHDAEAVEEALHV